MSDAPSAGESLDRAQALGRELAEIHERLRGELARVREQIESYAQGDTVGLTPLRAHCAAFCLTLIRHHTNEDGTAFPALGKRFPELESVLEQLRQDHVLVAGILREMQHLLATLTPGNVARAQAELAGLAAILESHFQWEERRLVGALNMLDTPQTGEELFGVKH